MNTSTSWDVIDPDCDTEVAGITNSQTQPQVDRTVNTNTDSGPANLHQGLKQVSDISLNQNLGTLYNQDFFVAGTTGRRLSQIPYKSNYPYPLPNGHSALQLRLPDLLIYLKTDTYLMDVNISEHYAITVTEYKRCQSHPNYIRPGHTGNCYKQSKVMLCDLVSIHHSLPPVECHKEYRQHQDKLNHLL